MKKIFFLAALALAFVFSGCNKDDNSSPSIVGTWTLISFVGYEQGSWGRNEYNDTYQKEDSPTQLIFNLDKSAVYNDLFYNETHNGSWKLNDRELTLNITNFTFGEEIHTVKVLSDNKLVLYFYDEDPDNSNFSYESTLTFVR